MKKFNGLYINNKKMEFTPKQLRRLKTYKKGDIISVNIHAYAHMFNAYLRIIAKELKPSRPNQRYFTKEMVIEQCKKGKSIRPVLVLYNDPFSKKMILAPLTTKKRENLNFELHENSYVMPDIFLYTKTKAKVMFDGVVHSNVDEKKIKDFLKMLKETKPKTHTLYLEYYSKCVNDAMRRKDIEFKKMLELLETMG